MIGTSVFVGTNNVKRNSKTFLLDQSFATGATAAYSLRKLKSSATKAVRVREDSGNTETDIGFSGAILDETALLNHVGSNNGFVTKWYDQSGNGNDASNSTASGQPQIVNSGTVLKKNGQPTLKFDGNDDFYSIPITQTTITEESVYMILTSLDTESVISNPRYFSQTKGSNDDFTITNPFIPVLDRGGSNNISQFDGSFINKTAINQNDQKLARAIHTGSKAKLGLQNNAFASTSSTLNTTIDKLLISSSNPSGEPFTDAYIQEIITYFNDKTNEDSQIQTNINGHYSIF